MTTLRDDARGHQVSTVGASGSATESMGGVAVIILSILVLAGVIPVILAPIAGIVFGAAFLIEGAALASKHSALMRAAAPSAGETLELGGGVTVEVVAGLACIVLGILALIGVAATALLPVLVITAGAGLILSAGAVQQLNNLRSDLYGVAASIQGVARAAVSGAVAAQLMAGAAVLALGIVALVRMGPYPSVLTVVGLLVAGVSITLSGAALSGRMLGLFRRG